MILIYLLALLPALLSLGKSRLFWWQLFGLLLIGTSLFEGRYVQAGILWLAALTISITFPRAR